MLARLIFSMNMICIEGIDAYVRTYADEYYGRIRGSNQTTGIDAAIVFLLVFTCLVSGFFAVCILGTLILGFFDNGFRCPCSNVRSAMKFMRSKG